MDILAPGELARRLIRFDTTSPGGTERESAYATRERLRNERRRLVGDVSRRTNKSHREVQARINRETKARAVANATIEQLERGNEILRRDLSR